MGRSLLQLFTVDISQRALSVPTDNLGKKKAPAPAPVADTRLVNEPGVACNR